jgi:hypothetical protein
LRRLGIFHLPKLKIITIGNLPVKPPQRNDLNQLASLIPGAIQAATLGKARADRGQGAVKNDARAATRLHIGARKYRYQTRYRSK